MKLHLFCKLFFMALYGTPVLSLANKRNCHLSFQILTPKFCSKILSFSYSSPQQWIQFPNNDERMWPQLQIGSKGYYIFLGIIVPVFVRKKATFIHADRCVFVTKSVLNATILTMSETSAYRYTYICIPTYIHIPHIYAYFYICIHICRKSGFCTLNCIRAFWREQPFYIQFGLTFIQVDEYCDILQKFFLVISLLFTKS